MYGMVRSMDDTPKSGWTVQLFTSFAEHKAAEYLYWHSRPVHERLAAGAARLGQLFQLLAKLEQLLQILLSRRVIAIEGMR